MEKMINSLHPLTTEQIVEIADMAAARSDDEGDIALNAALTVLELRMPEQEFIALCDKFAA